jgi:hypothetical protein
MATKTPPWPEPELRQRYRNRAAAFRAVGNTPMAGEDAAMA